MSERQIGVTFTPEERQILEKLSARLNIPLARVVREAALEGIDTWIERVQKREKFLKE
ncbi:MULTISPECIES: hypothetical protein [unclassified Coleofasciculus]|uniref:hypothetical protein n=1 Tax=unclassified Coleofasciculus TaxID=2692782 RepID=UPI001881D7C6|nr:MULTISPECIES: hypothetical protein [unclassified Coleofasciculus]MBE9128202.1 hypothetical protein [Coleofasciculus sp. LEGE 07081]MBE9150956.1 hypothetical protein [Coleofasciculus sp. LEGE 07092]